MKFNLAYPEFGIGFHSGWSDANNNPTQKLFVTLRNKVKLIESKYEVMINSGNLPPFLVKSNMGNIEGISSGVGSAILKFNGGYYKIKRNGYRDEGFISNKIPDRAFNIGKKGLSEGTDFEVGGAMSLEDAENEIKHEKIIEGLGIPLPQRTVGLYKILLPFEKSDAVAMIQKIESDYRVDELVISILINSFFEVYNEKAKIHIDKGEFYYPTYSISKELKKINNYKKLIYEIGKIIGGIYKKFHINGYLRGIGNSWYGNEIICKNGEIGVCDLESCFSKEEVGGKEVFEELCKTDLNLARTAFYDSMNYFDNSLASIIGSWLIDSFNEGYDKIYEGKLDVSEIENIITRFLKIKDKVIVNG